MVYVSGYHVNIGIYQTLAGKKDLLISDQFNHASIIDGLRLSHAKKIVFRHNDLKHLEQILKKTKGKYEKVFVVTEGVFSMEGDIPDLKHLVKICR